MKKLILIMTAFMICIGVIAKKYDNRDAERLQGYKILKVGSDKYILASSNIIRIVTISSMEDGYSNVVPTPELKHYSPNDPQLLISRTIALLRYKTFIYWVVEKYDKSDSKYTIEIQSFLVGEESIGSDSVPLISMSEPFVINTYSKPTNYTGAFIQEDKFYFFNSYGDLKVYTANNDGAPYFDFSNQPKSSHSYFISPPDNCSRLLEMYVKPTDAGGDLLTVWLNGMGYGVTFGVYHPTDTNDGFQSQPYKTETGLTEFAPRGHIPYYGTKILDLPMASYSENASDMTVFVSFCYDKGAFKSVKQYIGAFQVVCDNNNNVSEIKYVGPIYKNIQRLQNLDILIEPEKDKENDAGTNLNYRIMAGAWISKPSGQGNNIKPACTTLLNYSLKTDKTKAGYLKNEETYSADPAPGLDPGTYSINELDSFADFSIVPIGIIYFPPIVLPYDPEKLDEGELSIEEIYNDPDMMQNLYKFSNKDLFTENTDEDTYNSCKWLFLQDRGKSSFLDKIKNGNVWHLAENNSTDVSLQVSKKTSVGMTSNWNKEAVSVAVTNSNSSSTATNNIKAEGTDYLIKQSDDDYINKTAVFFFWEYPIAEQQLYCGTLKKNKSTSYSQNGTRSFSVIVPSGPPSLNTYFFDPNNPGEHPYVDGIQAVPKTYSLDKKISKTSKYDYLYNWNMYLKGGDNDLSDTEFTNQNTEALWAVNINSSSTQTIKLAMIDTSTEGTSMGNSGGVTIGIPKNDFFRANLNLTNTTTTTSSTRTSKSTEMGWSLIGQPGKVTNIKGNDLKFPKYTYNYYMIQERVPRADKQDWWVATKWREQGIAPWVMYYDVRSPLSSTKR